MKIAIRAQILFIAAAWLAATSTRADEPTNSPPLQLARYRTTSNAMSRLSAAPESAGANEPAPEPVASPEMNADADPAQPQPVWDDLGDGCDDCGSCATGPMRRGMWYGSVDYLLMRPRLSQGVAEVRRTLVTNTDVSPNTSTVTDSAQEFSFPYQSGFRAALGYRLLDCGGDFQVAYWRMTADSHFSDGPANTETDNPRLFGQLKNNPGNGGFLSASTGITANIFDVDFAKCLSFGGPQGACDACCFCPRWDLRFWAGARIADISRFDNNITTTPQASTAPTSSIVTGNIDARFTGAGPRVGIQGRRYFGANGFLSLYARASQAILIGDYRMSRSKTEFGDQQVPTVITNQFDRFSRTIPVTDIEVGGSWQIAPFTYISAGYFWQCWWDLGQSEGVIGTNYGPLDTSNILGFDGLFVRAEMLF
jgi:hypothetical protein